MNYIKLLIQSLYNQCVTINLYNLCNSYIILFCICLFLFYAIRDSDMKIPSNRYRTHNDKMFYSQDSGKCTFLTKKLHNFFLEVPIKSLFFSFSTLSYPHTCQHKFLCYILEKNILLHFQSLSLFVIHLVYSLFCTCVRLSTASYTYHTYIKYINSFFILPLHLLSEKKDFKIFQVMSGIIHCQVKMF